MTTLADLQSRNIASQNSASQAGGHDTEAVATGAVDPLPPPPAESAPVNDNNTTILQNDKPTNKQRNTPTNRQTNHLTNKPKDKPADTRNKKSASLSPMKVSDAAEGDTPARRVDGRTMRVRQDTADLTKVTSLRLASSTLDDLDEYCWHHRVRKQDVVQAALDMYFSATAEEETPE